MKSVVALFDACELRELFSSMRKECAEYSRNSDESACSQAAEKIDGFKGRIMDICRRPVFPLDWNDLHNAACHGGRRYASELVNMAREFMRQGGRVVLMRSTTLNSPPEVVREFSDENKLTEFASRWVTV